MTAITDETIAKVVRLESGAFAEAKAVLYRAYKNEPTFKYLFDFTRAGYKQRVRATIRELINLHFSTGQDVIGLALDDHLIAVALVGSPNIRLNLTSQINWRLRMMLTAGMDCTWRYIDYHKQIHACLPQDLHHELPLMGVDSKYRNLGYGKQLMKAVECICAENPRSVGIGLDTGNMRYLEFYKKLGYETVGEITLGNVTESVLFKNCSPSNK
ncbi:MAG: GNAT superfamily N-acetyltransferase [Oleiphilaceae bacterium]|jgi:GNAT superfamily N-acetyltransferase